jgi:Holliday junction resolvasome RuvABC endonuclease subunit
LTLIGLDPSLTNTGVVVLDPQTDTIQGVTVIQTGKQADRKNLRVGEDDLRRARHIARRLQAIIQATQPEALFGELPGGTKSNRAAKGFGLVLGAIGDVTDQHDLPTGWETQYGLKEACTGDGRANKEDVAEHVQGFYAWEDDLPQAKTRREHVFDAAAALYAARTSDLYRMAARSSSSHTPDGEHT